MPQEKKTHCHRGHEFTAENTHVDKEGSRRCRACRREEYRGLKAARAAFAADNFATYDEARLERIVAMVDRLTHR